MSLTRDPLLLALSTFWRQVDPNKVTMHDLRTSAEVLRTVLLPSTDPASFYYVPKEDYVAKRFNDKSFAQVQLTSADENKFTAWANDGPKNGLQAANELLGQGYKMSITWVIESNAFCVSLIGTEETAQNKNSIMTSWSDDLEECFLISAYKHLEVCNSGEWPTAANGKKWG
jgi:hypothetical protein